jgi:hypothetical protein
MKKTALKTSSRSATQATDSARSGWMANAIATKALRQKAPVMSHRTRNSRTAASACRTTLVT